MISYEKNHNYQHILELLEDGFIRADINGVITMVNHNLAEMFGYASPDEMIGVPMTDLYANPDERKEVIDRLRSEGKLINYELELRKKNKQTFWSISNIKFIYDDQGNIIGTEGVIRDISKRKEDEELLKAVSHDVQERMKELNLLYQATQVITQGGDLDKIISSVVEAIPPAWHYPEFTTARIIYSGKEYKSKDFQTSPWVQSADILVKGKKRGLIEIYFTKEMKKIDEGPFMKEERDLINTLAHYLGLAAEDIEMRQELKTSYQQLQAHEQQLKALNQQLRANNQQLSANEQQLRAANQQLSANEQQLRAANQQLSANEQQLRAANQQLLAGNQQLAASEQQLKINEKRFRKSEIIAHVGNWEYNIESQQFWGSDGAKRIYGFDLNAPSFSTDEVENCIPERNRVHQALIDLIEEDKPYDLEFEIITKDKGKKKIIHSMAELEKDKQGNPIKVSGVIIDITNRKLAEKHLKNSQTQLKNIVENSTNLFYAHDTKHKLTFVSPQVKEYLACEPEEAMIRWTEFATDNPMNEKAFQYTTKAIETGKRQPTYELELQPKSGEKIIVEVRESPVIEDGKVTGIVGSLVDITERKKAEEAINNITRRLSISTESANIGIWEMDLKTNELTWDPQMFELYGIKPKAFGGAYNAWQKGVHPDDIERSDAEVQDAIAGKKEFHTQFRVVWPDGQIRHIEAHAIVTRDADNKPEKMIGVNWDITEQKQNELDLIKAKEKAEESDKLKSAFLANMSHEIRTPMNGILGFTSLLERPNLSEETREQYIQIIQKSGKRMLDTVNDLILISKIETGQEELHLEEARPCAIIGEIAEFFEPSAKEKGLEIVLGQACKDVVLIDATKFHSIISNLIKNAIKFTDKGHISVKNVMEKTKMTITVEDTGPGIPLDRQEAIFDRFIQADIMDSKAMEGSGLGLSIVKAYVEMMDGEISLESEPGKGSCFTVTLPINRVREKQHETQDTDDKGPDINFSKILIVEDDDISYRHLSISLEPFSEQVLHAWNGEEAVSLAKEHRDIDLILMDIKMPVMDGYSATKAIREFNKDVMIVAQTAYALPEDEQNSYDAGCNAYISKPVDINRLLSIINKA